MKMSASGQRGNRGSQGSTWQPLGRASAHASDSTRAASGGGDPPRDHQFANVSLMPPEGDRPGVRDAGSEPDLDELMKRALATSPEPLPYHHLLEQRTGQSLAHVAVHTGPEASAVLNALGADAATAGDHILLREHRPDIQTVAHEVIHVLQGRPGSQAQVDRITEPHAPAEVEATRMAPEVDEKKRDEDDAPLKPERSLEPGSLALQRSDDLSEPSGGGTALLERPEPSPAAEPDSASAGPSPVAPGAQTGELSLLPDLGSDVSDTPEWELPPTPEPGVTAEDVAAREAALAEAEAALQAAGDVTGYVDGFASAPPSVKARNQDRFGDSMNDLVQKDSEEFQGSLPDFHARLNTQAEPVEPVEVRPPQAGAVTLETGHVEPAPVPNLPPTPDVGRYTANEGVSRWLDFLSPGEPSGSARQIDESLSSVQTTDPEIPKPGPPPAIELSGETDPERIQNQSEAGTEQALTKRDEAQASVVNGPGPEQVQPVEMDEVYTVDELPVPSVTAPTPSADAQAYVEKGLPAEVQTAFDQEQHAAMESSMAEARTQVAITATEHRDQRQAAVAEAEEEVRTQSEETDTEQRDTVIQARQSIQTERQATLDAQGQAVADLEVNVDQRKRDDNKDINDRVTEDQGKIDTEYTDAEKDVDTEVAEGERKAEQERRDAEKKSENQSWWERAKSFVKDAFNALVNAISVVFAAVRNAVSRILDAVKEAAMKLIDAAASFIKSAIEAFGEFLKAAITGLLGGIFPELAEKLNQAIDSAVTAATDFVDKAAEKLKAGVAALVDGLKAGLNKLLDALEAGLTLAVSFVQAALTSDWSGLLKKVLEAVLKVIGVNPEEFYAFVGRAEETFKLIIDAPGQFLSNVIDAFTGGVQLFADNFLTHLQAGIIGWLTGALGSAGLQIPQQFDLMGVLSLVQQILGLTWDWLRQKAVKLVGEKNVERIEYIAGWVQTLITEGWGGVWERVKTELATLRDQVLGAIKTFLVGRVVIAAITKLASLFNPVGAVVQLVLTAWNLYTFLRDQLARIVQVVQTVVDAIGDIARGILDPAKKRVEEVLVSLLPLAIDLLARLLGLGNVGKKVQEILQRVRDTVDQAITKLIERVLAAFRGDREPGAEPAATKPVDPTDHTAVASSVVEEIQKVDTSAEFSVVRSRIEERAKSLENHWSPILGPNVGLTVSIALASADRPADTVDFEVLVAPNTTRRKSSVKTESKPPVRLENGVLIVTHKNKDVRFEVGDPIQAASGSGWLRGPHIITKFSTDTISGQSFIRLTYDTKPPTTATTVLAERYPLDWRKPIPSLDELDPEVLEQENAIPLSQAWTNFTLAKKVLNYRAHGIQHVNPRGKDWEHIVEQSSGGPNSAENLALADSTLNNLLGAYYGTLRVYPMLAIEDITEPVKLRDNLKGKSAAIQRQWKLRVYASDDFRLSLNWREHDRRGQYQELS